MLFSTLQNSKASDKPCSGRPHMCHRGLLYIDTESCSEGEMLFAKQFTRPDICSFTLKLIELCCRAFLMVGSTGKYRR